MLAGNPLQVNVVELRRMVGNQETVSEQVLFDDLALPAARVDASSAVGIDLLLEAVSGGVSAGGTLRAKWLGECRRCLDRVEGTVVIDVAEVFEPRPTEGETYPIQDDVIDLEPLIREALILGLPISPLCSEDCAGPLPEEFPVVVESDDDPPPADPRWAALDELKFD